MHVEIWSDIACPWCYVGKRRFEAALAQFEHREDVTATWRSFELDPQAPAQREGDLTEHLARKYGRTVEEAQAMHDQMTQVAAADGLEFHFERARSGNTFDAHRLVHLAAAHGKQDAMKERLFRAYLTEGRLVSDRETLEALGAELDLPADEVREVLLTERYAEDVRDDERTAHALGISAVPCFVIDRKMGASGAQPPEVLLDFLRQGWAAREPIAMMADGVAEGDACGPDGC